MSEYDHYMCNVFSLWWCKYWLFNSEDLRNLAENVEHCELSIFCPISHTFVFLCTHTHTHTLSLSLSLSLSHALTHTLTHSHTHTPLSLPTPQCGWFPACHIPIHCRAHTQQVQRLIHVTSDILLDCWSDAVWGCGLGRSAAPHTTVPQLETLHFAVVCACLFRGLSLLSAAREPEVPPGGELCVSE